MFGKRSYSIIADKKGRDVEIDENLISDVIFVYQTRFGSFKAYNAMTGKQSNNINKVVRPEHRFIILDGEVYKNGIQGMYVKRTGDALCFIKVNFKNIKGHRWQYKEIDRTYINKPSEPCKNLNYNNAYDICGQTVFVGHNKESTIPQTGSFIREYCRRPNIAFVGAKEEAQAFFKGSLTGINAVRYPFHIICQFNRLASFDEALEWYSAIDKNKQYKLVKEKNDGDYVEFKKDELDDRIFFVGKGICFYECDKELELPPLPQYIVMKMDKFARDHIDYMKRKMDTGYALDEWCEEFGILQRVDNYFILRVFYVSFIYRGNLDRTGWKFIEFRRVKIDKGCLVPKHLLKVRVIGIYGSFKGSVLEHVSYILHEDTMYKINSYEKFNITGTDYCIDSVMEVINSPLFEKLLNAKDDDEYKMLLLMRLQTSGRHADEYIKETIGDVDENEKSLNKILGIPKGMLDYVLTRENSYSLEGIGKCKEIFSSSKEAKQYFMRMNKEEWQWLYRAINTNIVFYMNNKFFASMVKNFGYKNWQRYFNHVKDLSRDDDLSVYEDYINCVELLGIGKDSEWNIKGDTLKRTMDSLMIPYMAALDETKYKGLKEGFDKQQKEWQEYEYKEDKYMIISPKAPSELLAEGVKLKHCVKSYMDAVAIGRTMVLFIRDVKYPNIPFYTLEIRKNRIRQCHGICNSTIYRADGLSDFLERFCKAKNVEYADGASCEAV